MHDGGRVDRRVSSHLVGLSEIFLGMSDIASSSRRVFSVAGLFLASSILIGCGEEKPADSGAAGAAPSATTTADKDASVVKKGGRQLNADGPSARELRNEKLKASGGQ